MTVMAEREVQADASNPLGLEGIEFVEYATARPQALGGYPAMLQSQSRRSDRAVEGGGLENRCSSDGTGGSNPSSSAIFSSMLPRIPRRIIG